MLGLDLGKNDYYCHKKGRGNGRVTADPMVLWALAHTLALGSECLTPLSALTSTELLVPELLLQH